MAHYQEISCKSALYRINSRYLPYHWDLNIYRGCAHRCQYCYALYSHQYLEDNRFFDTIYIKRNMAERLALELAKPSWKREVINIGGITDSYQPIVPRLTDSTENLSAIYENGKAAGVDYILPGLLYLKSSTRQNFLAFIHREFPQHMDSFLLLYGRGGLDKEYKQSFYKKLHQIKVRYGIPSRPEPLQAAPDSYDGQQLSLF